MAFLMQHEVNNTGLIGEYWKIHDIKIDIDGGVVYITTLLYKDKEARDSGKNPIWTVVDPIVLTDILYKELQTPVLTMMDIYNTLRSTFYKELKLNRFLGAEDI